MSNLTPSQVAVVGMMTHGQEQQKHGFELILKRSDFYIFFEELKQKGLFESKHSPSPIKAEDGGYYVPYWSALDYLVRLSEYSNTSQDKNMAEKIMKIVREVSSREKLDNFLTCHRLAKCMKSLPTSVVTLGDIDLFHQWMRIEERGSLIGSEIASGMFSHFLNGPETDDLDKSLRLLEIATALRPKDTRSDEQAGYIEDHWLKELINRNSRAIGEKLGKRGLDVLISRLKEVYIDDRSVRSWQYRPAVEQHSQNYSWRGVENIFVDGVREAALGLIDSAPEKALPITKEMFEDQSEIVRRIAIYLVNSRWDSLKNIFLHKISTPLFNTGHLHELYNLLKTHFTDFPEEIKKELLKSIEGLPRPEGEESENRWQRIQYKWLSAIQGQGYAPVEERYKELSANPHIGLSDHPDFNSYMQTSWGTGPSPYTPQELISFVYDGSIVEKLNSFKEEGGWRGPTERSLADAIEKAVALDPQLFIDNLPKFLGAKRPYQYGVINGFKKQWDSSKEKGGEINWDSTWRKLTDLFKTLLNDNRLWEEKATQDENLTPNVEWLITLIADFIQSGTRDDAHACPEEVHADLWGMLNILINKVKASPTIEEKDSMNWAINTSKGRVIEAFINFALRVCRLEDKSDTGNHSKAWEMVEPVFSHEIDLCKDANFEFSTLSAAYCSQIEYLSKEWLEKNFEKIFPLKYVTNLSCAAGGLCYAPARSVTYELLRKHKIIEAILQLELEREIVRESVIQRIALAYIWGIENLDSDIISQFFTPAPAGIDVLKEICDFFWSIHEKDLDDKQVLLVTSFIKKIFSHKDIIALQPKALLKSVGKLICYLKHVGDADLEWVLKAAPYLGDDFMFVEELERLADISPQQVSKILSVFLEHHRIYHDYESRYLRTLEKLSQYPELRLEVAAHAAKLKDLPGMKELWEKVTLET